MIDAAALIERERFMTLATADAEGMPWATPVWYAPDGPSELLWVSKPGSRHSRNLAVRPQLALVIFDSRQTPGGDVQAVYMEGRAEEADPARIVAFSERSVAQGMPEWPVVPEHLRLYRAVISQHWVLDAREERVAVSPERTGAGGTS